MAWHSISNFPLSRNEIKTSNDLMQHRKLWTFRIGFDKHQWFYWYCFQWALSNEYLTSISDLIDIVFNDWLRFKLFSLKKMNRREFYTCRRASCHISHSECGEKFSLVIQSSLPPKRSFSTKYWISLGPVWTTDFQNMNNRVARFS